MGSKEELLSYNIYAMYTWLILVLLLLVSALIADWVYTRRARMLLSDLPGFLRLPLVGSVRLIGSTRNAYKLLVEISEKAEQTRLPFVAWLGPVPLVVLSEPEDVKLATNAFVEKPYYYQFWKIYIGDGLLTAPGRIWKKNIKKLGGVFSGNIVNGFQEIFNVQGQKLVEKLKHEAGGKPFDVMHKYLSNTFLQSICQIALGGSQISESIVTAEYHSSLQRFLELTMRRALNILHHPNFIYRHTSSYKELVKCVRVLNNVSNNIVKRSLQDRGEVRNTQKPRNETENENTTTFKSYLDILLEMQEQDPIWSQEHIKAEVDTIIAAGHETVTSAFFLILHMLGCNSYVQKKVYDEIKAIFGESNRKVEKEDLSRMEYCKAVVLETLRLLPPAPFVLRYADYDLKLGSCTIPAGSSVLVNVLAAGRSRHQWGEDALEFRPERWLDGSPAQSTAFLPFSYGKRSCIGKRYALAILKTTIAHCVRQFQFTSQAEELEIKMDVILKPVAGHLIQVDLRK